MSLSGFLGLHFLPLVGMRSRTDRQTRSVSPRLVLCVAKLDRLGQVSMSYCRKLWRWNWLRDRDYVWDILPDGPVGNMVARQS